MNYGPGQKQTRYGWVDLGNPRPEQINLRDIAYQGARVYRFGGAAMRQMSIAEHMVNVSEVVRGRGWDIEAAALLHDSEESIIGFDPPTPFKHVCPEIRAVMDTIRRAIFLRFDVPYAALREIKRADRIAVATEAAVIMPNGIEGWALDDVEQDPRCAPRCWDEYTAEERWLERASELGLFDVGNRARLAVS